MSRRRLYRKSLYSLLLAFALALAAAAPLRADEPPDTAAKPADAKPADGKISNESPVGRALLGKKRGEKVVVKVPAGDFTYTIRSIS